MVQGQAFVTLPTGIESYRVSLNKLGGAMPELSVVTGLKELWASGNAITGTFPSSLVTLTALGTYLVTMTRKSYCLC
jgi:hypothetical protein